MKYRKLKIAVAVTAPTAVVLIFIFKEQIMDLSRFFGVCKLYTLTGIHCPSCGITRCIRAMLDGDILLSLRNNLAVPFMVLLIFLSYVELLCDIFGKKVKLIPRKSLFWWIVLGVFIIYFILRNFIPEIAPVI